MASNAVEFILSLRDRLTGPARTATKSLDGVNKALKVVDGGTAKVARASGLGAKQMHTFGAASATAGRMAHILSRTLGNRTAIGFVKAHGAASRFAGALPSMGSTMGALGSGAASLGPMLLGVGAALLAVGAGGVGLVAAGAKYASEMAGFKEQTLFAYKYILGGSARAEMMFAEADDLARAMGTKTTSVAESMRELMGGGFSESQSKNITAAIADVGALSPTADTGAISAQLAQMKGAGRVLAEDLKPLLSAGLNDDMFYQVLREMTGKTDQKDLKKMLETGKVSADMGIEAILETVNRMGGNKGLGSVAAARANETMQGQVDQAKAMFERLFMSIQSGPAGAAIGALAKQVGSFLDPKGASGQRILAVLSAMAAGVAGVLASLQGGALDTFLSGALSMFETLRPIVGAFFDAFGAGFGEAITAVRAIVGAFSSGSGPSLDFVAIARALGSAFAFFAVGLGSVLALLGGLVAGIGLVVIGIGTALVDMVGAVAEFAAEFGDAGLDIASHFIAGLVGGIATGAIEVVSAVVALGSSAIDGVKGIFKIQSPSRVMEEVGGFVAAGFTQGVDAGAPEASGAVASLVAPSALGSIARGAAGGGSSASVGDINVTVTGIDTSDAEGLGASIAAQVREQVRLVLMGYASELGAAPAGA